MTTDLTFFTNEPGATLLDRFKRTLSDIKYFEVIATDFTQKQIDPANFAKKLLGQIVFLYFLQKKGWLGVEPGQPWGSGAKDFLRRLFQQDKKNSLIKAGWTITHDPFRIRLTRKNLFVDLGAERLIAADRGTEKIAVEIKSFTHASDIKDLEDALGQFILYERLLIRYAPERTLYLAVSDSVYKTVFEEEAGQILLEDKLIRLLTFDPEQEVLSQWIPT